jgi:hypothetical protein
MQADQALYGGDHASQIQTILNQPGIAIVQPNRIAPNFRDAYMQHWNADLQYELGPHWMIDLAYVGSRGTHLPSVRDLNQTSPVTRLETSVPLLESASPFTHPALKMPPDM